MKFFHIGDLHLGKKLSGENLLSQQAHILNEIVKMADKERPEAILIAGDVYDKSVPSAEAVTLLDYFLNRLVNLRVKVFLISGNHDSPERLSFASAILSDSGVYVAGMVKRKITCITLTDSFGPLHIHLLPFFKPAMLRPWFSVEMVDTQQGMEKLLIENPPIKGERNLLMAHQFVTWQQEKPVISESETMSLGGAEEVDASLFDEYDYVALGHIHRPQKIKRPEVRYAGSPLAYSFSELNHKKSITMIELRERGNLSIRKLLLHPQKQMVVLRDTLSNLLGGTYHQYRQNTYLSVVMTDEEQMENPVEILRDYFPGLLEFSVENTRTGSMNGEWDAGKALLYRTPKELFEEFYRLQNNVSLSSKEKEILENIYQCTEQGEME